MKTKAILIAVSVLAATPAVADPQMMVLAAAAKYEVPPDLALGISYVESRNRCGLVGAAGERGPMQILPKTAKGLGFHDIQNASCETQVEAAMVYLKRCLDRAGGNHKRAAACYNAGPKALSWRTLPSRVASYVKKVFN